MMRLGRITGCFALVFVAMAGCALDGEEVGKGAGNLDGDDDASTGAACGGPLDVVCPSGSYCGHEPGTCADATHIGSCTPTPAGCPDIWAPVCGCDGVTYGNDCDAAAAGASVLHDGSCEEPPMACGGPLDVVCPEGEYCATPRGMCSEIGECQPLGDILCPENYDPVCGCDGTTYSNECFATAAGVSVDHCGACEEVETCGGFTGEQCDDASEYCLYPEGTCGDADLQGTCETRPLGCPDNWDPVCGCDGVTYSNRCDAAAAGVSIAAQGACPAVD
jgi:hypothetical protein